MMYFQVTTCEGRPLGAEECHLLDVWHHKFPENINLQYLLHIYYRYNLQCVLRVQCSIEIYVLTLEDASISPPIITGAPDF